jgi:hypothetical protein
VKSKAKKGGGVRLYYVVPFTSLSAN